MHITVALQETIRGRIDIIHDVVLWHFATCTSVNCLTYMCPGHDIKFTTSTQSEIILNRVCGICFGIGRR